MKRILFVDDEPHIIQALQRMLRTYRKEWEMFFALSGVSALEILDKQKIDVIISDMRMPHMDGAELLELVMKKHPKVIRIILSGQSGNEMILKSVKPAHQFLSKPCDAQTLVNTIQKALQLRDLLNNDTVKNLVSQIDALPSLPSLYVEIVDKLNESDVSLSDIGQIIRKDVSMTAEILKLVNSSFFGFFKKISKPEQAVSLLGLNTIRSLVLSIKVFSQYEVKGIPAVSIEELWDHSFLTGIFTKAILAKINTNADYIDNAFTVGLIHDIGIVTLTTKIPDKYKEVCNYALKNMVTIAESEYHILGSSHAEIGGYLLGLWGFSDLVTDAVARHHFLNVQGEYDDLTFCVHIADAFSQKITGKNQGLPIEEINEKVQKDPRFVKNSEEW